MASETWNETIDRPAVDAVVYALYKSLEGFGEQRADLLESVGDRMLEYLVKVGGAGSPTRPDEFAESLGGLLRENGYANGIEVRMKGTPPSPSVPHLVESMLPTGTRTDDGRSASPPEGGSEGSGKVDWVLYEMFLYGMTKALDDQLGAQAQFVLDRVGKETIDYLIRNHIVEPSDDPGVFFQRVEDFFMNAGLARGAEFRFEGSPPTSVVAEWRYPRYFTNVMKRLHKEGGSVLLACPVCLAGETILGGPNGWKFQHFTELRFLPRGRVQYRHKVIQPGETFTEEDAKKIAEMK